MKERISLYQVALMLIITIGGTAILFLPRILIEKSGRDAWLTGLILLVFGLLVSILYTLLIRRMKTSNFIEFNKKTVGKFLTFPLAINLTAYFIMISGIVVRQTAEVMVANYFSLTPLWFINITLILAAAVFVYYGLETMARSAEILFYLLLFIFLSVLFLLVDELNPQYIQPVLGKGIKPVIKGLFPGLIFFSEIFIILIWAPNLKKRNKVYKSLIAGTLIAGLIFIILIYFSITFFGVALADELTLPLVTMVSYVSKLGIFERLDPLIIFFWVGAGLGKAIYFLYGAVYTLHKLFNFNNYYLIIIFIIPFIFYFSFYYFQNIVQVTDFIAGSAPYFVSVQVLYPLLLYLISLIRGVSGNE